MELRVILGQLAAPERLATPAPTLEEIVAYLVGELTRAEEDELQDRLALHPEATQLLLDILDPSRLTVGDDADLPLSSLNDLRQRLRDEGLFDERR